MIYLKKIEEIEEFFNAGCKNKIIESQMLGNSGRS